MALNHPSYVDIGEEYDTSEYEFYQGMISSASLNSRTSVNWQTTLPPIS